MMYHFEPNHIIHQFDSSKVLFKTLNICTLNKSKLIEIINSISESDLFIYSITEINIYQETFDSFKDIIPNHIKQFIQYRKFNTIKGGILLLYSQKLNVKLNQEYRDQNDFRLIFANQKPNDREEILLVACQLPTVDHIQWQNLQEELRPDITQEELRVHNGQLREQSQQHQLFQTLLDPEVCAYSKVILFGDFNTHLVQLNDNPQQRQISQRDSLLQTLQQAGMRKVDFNPDNQFEFTYFKGDKKSCVDYFIASESLINSFSSVRIYNEASITTDHNCLSTNLNIQVSQVQNMRNIENSWFVNSCILKSEKKLEEQQGYLENINTENMSLQNLVEAIKRPLIKVCEEKKKYQVDDNQTRQLKRVKNTHLRHGRFRQATEVGRVLRKQVWQVRKARWEDRLAEILRNRRSSARDWWALTTRWVKPRRRKVNLMRNEQGLEDVDHTLDQFKNFFQSLHYRNVFDPVLEPHEDWIAVFVLKQQPSEAFERQFELISPWINSDSVIDTVHLNEIFTTLNNQFNRNQTFNDIINSKNLSINRTIDDFQQSPYQGLLVTIEELKQQIRYLNQNKAPGFDCVDNRILRSLTDKILLRLCDLFNDILNFTYIDEKLKQVIITLLSKTNRVNPEVGDQRPISLLSFVFKLLEKILLKRMHLPFNHLAFGFKQSNSTVDMLWVFNRTVQQLQQRRGLLAVEQGDFVKAFNHCNMYKLICKLIRYGVDRNLLATSVHMFISQKVQFKIGHNLSRNHIKFNVQALHQGGCGSPVLFTTLLQDMLSAIESQETIMPAIPSPSQLHQVNHVTQADDLNNLHFYPSYTRNGVISADLHRKHTRLVADSGEMDLTFSGEKSKWLTNDVHKLNNLVSAWSDWEVVNYTKLLGVRFKIDNSMKFNYNDQFDYVFTKFINSLEKLKIAQSRNKFLSIKQTINFTKSFSLPIIDYANIIIEFNKKQMKMLDSILQKKIKNIIGIKWTGLTLNVAICFNLFGYSDRRQVAKVMFYLKHSILNRESINACSSSIKNDVFFNHVEYISNLISEINFSGLQDWLKNKRVITEFNQEDLSNFELLRMTQLHLKPSLFWNHQASQLRTFIWRQMKIRIMALEAGYEGQDSMAVLDAFVRDRRAELTGLEQDVGKWALKHHTFQYVFKFLDYDSVHNSFEVNSDRKLNKRFLKLLMCNQRLNQRTRLVTYDAVTDTQASNGRCVCCAEGRADGIYEDEFHFLIGCNMYTDLRSLAFNDMMLASGSRLEWDVFHSCLDFFLFASFETVSMYFDNSMDLTQQNKFNKIGKLLINSMLDRRKKFLEENANNMNIRLDIEQEEIQNRYKNTFLWKQ